MGQPAWTAKAKQAARDKGHTLYKMSLRTPTIATDSSGVVPTDIGMAVLVLVRADPAEPEMVEAVAALLRLEERYAEERRKRARTVKK